MKAVRIASTRVGQPPPPRLLLEDQHLIVLSKPAGLLSQGEHRGDPNLVDWLRSYLGRPYVGLIHRLDRNTSGIMIVAKRTKAAQRLTDALQKGDIRRTYLGWVIGNFGSPVGNSVHWTHHLKKNPKTNTVQVVNTGGQEAILTAKPLAYSKLNQTPITLVEFRLETGRSHQIRAQSAYEGFPLLGDHKYSSSKIKFPIPPFPRPALHSFQIEFPHPMTGEWLQLEDPLPPDLKQLLKIQPFK